MIVLDREAVLAAATITECADALERHLLATPRVPALTAQEPTPCRSVGAGTREGRDPARTFVELPAGELIVMPSRVTGTPTVKLVTVATDPASPGGRIKGVHVVFDAESLDTVAVLDAAALTLRRTAAVSLVALRRLARPDADRLLLFGSGPQARAHLDAVAAEWPLSWVGVVSRDAANVESFVVTARESYPTLVIEPVSAAGVPRAVASASIVVCATTSPTPVFADGPLAVGACLVAVGSHRAEMHEIPAAVLGRSLVVVEDGETALREAGDVVVALHQGLVSETELVELGDLVRGPAVPEGDPPRVFKSVGMAWEDAVVSALMVERSEK